MKSMICLLAALLLPVAPTRPTQKVGDVKIEPYVFESAKKQKVDAELGHLIVPENRRNPHSRLIELAFVRFKSTSPNPGPPIVYLAGGPGGSGIGTARGTRFSLFQAMREVGDVIALDQRGTGMSKPNLFCREKLSLPFEKAHLSEDLLEEYRKKSLDCARSWREQGVDLLGYNTNESADDIEDLRKALGVPKVSLWAISYGTHLALTALRRHEKSFHRVILAGVEGPSHTIKLPSNVQRHLITLDKLVKADPELSKEIPDFLGLINTVLDRLEKEPAIVEVTDPATQQKVKLTINKFVVQMMTIANLGDGQASLPRRYDLLAKGDLSGAVRFWLDMLTRQSGIGSAMAAMMDCSSGVSPQRRRQIAIEAKSSLLGDLIDFPFPDVCDAWGSPDLGESFREPVKSETPALFISGTLDVRTPISNAEEVRSGFRTSTHLIVDGATHSDPLFLSSPEIKKVMMEFMKGEPVSTTRITLPPLKFVPLSR